MEIFNSKNRWMEIYPAGEIEKEWIYVPWAVMGPSAVISMYTRAALIYTTQILFMEEVLAKISRPATVFISPVVQSEEISSVTNLGKF